MVPDEVAPWVSARGNCPCSTSLQKTRPAPPMNPTTIDDPMLGWQNGELSRSCAVGLTWARLDRLVEEIDPHPNLESTEPR